MTKALLISENLVFNSTCDEAGDGDRGAQDYSVTVTPPGWTGNGDAQSYNAGENSADPADLDLEFAYSHHLADPSQGHGHAFDHSYFSGGPDNAVSTLTQEINFDGGQSGLGFEVAGHFGGYGGQDDSMTLTIQFYNTDHHNSSHSDVGDPIVIGGFDDAERGGVTDLLFDSALGAVPNGADGVRLTLTATRAPGGGTYNDGYAEDVSFALTGTNLTNAYVDVTGNTNFLHQSIPATVGIWYNEGSGAAATFSSSQFGAGGISLEGDVLAQGAAGDVMNINLTANANFDMSQMFFDYSWAGLVSFHGNAAGDTVTTCYANWSYSGGSGADIVNVSGLSGDVAHFAFNGAGGDDQVQTAVLAGGTLNGGSGTDALSLHAGIGNGFYTLTGVTNFEHIGMYDETSFALTMDDANVAKNKTLVVDGSGLTHALFVNGGAEKDGTLTLFGGSAVDVLIGGAHANNFTGNGNSDTMAGGNGDDTFLYRFVSDSTSTGHDSITGFNVRHDHIDISQLPGITFSGMETQNKNCAVSAGNFDHDIGVAANAAHLRANHAIILTPKTGDFVGHSFLVIDVNNVAGYQANQDLVIQLSGFNGKGFVAGDIIAGHARAPVDMADSVAFDHIFAGLSAHHAGSFNADVLGMLY